MEKKKRVKARLTVSREFRHTTTWRPVASIAGASAGAREAKQR
jgi:hypothetical protein